MKTTFSPPVAAPIGPAIHALPATVEAQPSQSVVAVRGPELRRDPERFRTRAGRSKSRQGIRASWWAGLWSVSKSSRRANAWPGSQLKTGPGKRLMGSESGMATAEYAITTLAAVGLAGLLVVILRSEEVRGFLLNVIRTALSLP